MVLSAYRLEEGYNPCERVDEQILSFFLLVFSNLALNFSARKMLKLSVGILKVRSAMEEKKVFIETYGCQMNVSDSERIATSLKKEGFRLVENEAEADVILINTCSVREKAENKLYVRIGEIRKKRGKNVLLGVTGCVAQLEGEEIFYRFDRKAEQGVDFIFGTRATGRATEILKKVLETGERVIDTHERESGYDWSFDLAVSHSKFVAFLPIIEGCNKFCTYCIVPFSRGREVSLPPEEVIKQAQNLVAKGVQEIHLIGQNVNSYRPRDLGILERFPGATPFSRLLRAVAELSGCKRIKFTTSFPRDFHADIVTAMEEYENLCNWVHLPVQSGSDKILRAMRRGHTIDSYMKKVEVIKNSSKQIALTTDIIVGFPGETEEDFMHTVELVKRCEFHHAYIFKYSPRPGTPAAERMTDDVSPEEKRRRFIYLESVQKEIQRRVWRDNYLNKVVSVLVEGHSKKGGNLSGHTTCNKVVNFPGDESLIGKIVDVKVVECKNNSLFGSL